MRETATQAAQREAEAEGNRAEAAEAARTRPQRDPDVAWKQWHLEKPSILTGDGAKQRGWSVGVLELRGRGQHDADGKIDASRVRKPRDVVERNNQRLTDAHSFS